MESQLVGAAPPNFSKPLEDRTADKFSIELQNRLRREVVAPKGVVNGHQKMLPQSSGCG
jgi:hypothetical protein